MHLKFSDVYPNHHPFEGVVLTYPVPHKCEWESTDLRQSMHRDLLFHLSYAYFSLTKAPLPPCDPSLFL